MKKRVVIALGGNALGNSPKEQLELIKNTAKKIVDITEKGYDIVIVHGNGPQVGMINLAHEVAHNSVNSPVMPFAECGAMSQGYIGYHLQQSIQKEVKKRGLRRSCVTVVTQVLVDKDDPAFSNPTKPIGSFYTKEEALKMQEETGYTFKEDAGRGYRRVIASPKPIKIVEAKVISELVKKHNIVIAAGGGGIPVIESKEGLVGVDAVIDKDKTSAKLAISLKAHIFMILTAVDKVYLNYNTENQKAINKMSVKKAKEYMANHEFKEGSMLPKVEACIDFASKRRGKAIIASLENAKKAVLGKSGTKIYK